MSVGQAPSKQVNDDADDFKPPVAVLALADLLAGLPKCLPQADDATGLRAAFALVRQAQDALRDPTLPLLPKPPAPTELAPLPLDAMLRSSGSQAHDSPPPPYTAVGATDVEMR